FCGQMAVAGTYYLYPYFTGRMVNRALANLHFWLWQFGIFAKVMLMYALGYAYFPRWVVDFLPLPEWTGAQLWLTVAGAAIGLGFLVFAINLAISTRHGAAAPTDPWAISATGSGAAAAAAAPAE
ncbi:MAG TPA: cbb3-type cytochrome c oxidase subunit I, partial [Kiloniellales bacterium]